MANMKPPRDTPRRRKMVVTDRYQDFIESGMSFADLSDEEVWRGQLKDQGGAFRGRPPAALPREFFHGMLQEQHKRFMDGMPALVQQAMKTLQDVMATPMPQPGDAARVKAATYIIDRFAGKTPETVQMMAHIKTEPDWHDVAEDILVVMEDDHDQ